MEKEIQNENRFDRIESQLFQVKVMLIILICLCLLGFYGVSRSLLVDVFGVITGILEILLVTVLLAAPVIFIVWITAKTSTSKMNAKIEKQLQNIINEAKSDK
jgi:hypothetical protein